MEKYSKKINYFIEHFTYVYDFFGAIALLGNMNIGKFCQSLLKFHILKNKYFFIEVLKVNPTYVTCVY